VRLLGAQPLLDDIADLATRPASRSPRPPPLIPPRGSRVGIDRALRSTSSPPALEVLRKLADGLTNRGIGRRLYSSEKTVGVHAARIFTKAGVHSRAQASALLHRSGPTD